MDPLGETYKKVKLSCGNMAVDNDSLYKMIGVNVVANSWTKFKTKIYTINGKETLYWMLGAGLRIPVATTIARGWFGEKPPGHFLHYKDSNRLNCDVSNLEYRIQENKNGNPTGITYDKIKKRWRVQRPGLKKTCHKTKEEAIQSMVDQGVVLIQEKEDEEEDTIIEEEIVYQTDDRTPEQIAKDEAEEALLSK